MAVLYAPLLDSNLVPVAPMAAIPGFFSALKRQGWSVANSWSAINIGLIVNATQATGSGIGSCVLDCIAPFDMEAITIVDWHTFRNTAANGVIYAEQPAGNPIYANYTVVIPNTNAAWSNLWPSYQVRFGGMNTICHDGSQFITSDPLNVPLIPKGSHYFVVKTVSVTNRGAQPTAPTVVAGNGSYAVSAGTYQVAYTYVFSDGTEGRISLPTAVTLTGSGTGGTADITVPADPGNGAIGCRFYIGPLAGTSTGMVYDAGLGISLFGASIIWPLNFSTWSGITQYAQKQRSLGNLVAYGSVGYMGGAASLSNVYGRGTGDIRLTTMDLTVMGNNVSPNAGSGSMSVPFVILGWCPSGPQKTVVLSDESIGSVNQADGAFGYSRGCYFSRACLAQTSAFGYNSAITPAAGYINMSCPSEKLDTYDSYPYGVMRQQVEQLATTGVNGYGVNNGYDITFFQHCVFVASRRLKWGMGAGQRTCLPRTTSTDGHQTIANQKFVSNSQEFGRRQANTFFLNNGGTVATVGEAMWRVGASSFSPASTITGGDGVATNFYPSQVFQKGTEVVKVGGVTKVLTTDYSYTNTFTLNGINYASSITFVSAPANAATVTMDYTSITGWKNAVIAYSSITNGNLFVWDAASAIEVNGAGTPGTNGGWWLPPVSTTPLLSGTLTSVSFTNNFADSGVTMTLNQYSGYEFLITNDAGTPSLNFTHQSLIGNTVTAFTTAGPLAALPDVGATYSIVSCNTIDGTHLSTQGAILVSQKCDMTLIS